MIKRSVALSLFCAACGSLAYGVTGVIEGEYPASTFTGDTVASGEVIMTGLATFGSEGTMTALDESSAFYTWDLVAGTSEVAKTVIKVNANYVLNAPVYFSGYSSGGNLWYATEIAAGKSVTFSDLRFAAAQMAGRQGLQFIAARTNDVSKFGHVYLSVSSDSVLNTAGCREHWLRYVNVHAMSGYNYGDLHFQYGSHFTVEADNVKLFYVRVRQPYQGVGGGRQNLTDVYNACAGKIFMNGYNIWIEGIQWNPSSGKATHELVNCTDFYLDFGENSKAQYAYIGAFSEHGKVSATNWQNNWDFDRFFISNMGVNDMLVFGMDPFSYKVGDGDAQVYLINVLSRILEINGNFVDGNVEYLTSITKQLTGDDTDNPDLIGKWAMIIIPEPAEIAAALGFAALCMAAFCRRRAK